MVSSKDLFQSALNLESGGLSEVGVGGVGGGGGGVAGLRVDD